MKLFVPSNRIKIILVLLLVFLGAGSVIYNQYLVSKILEQERSSVELWAKGIEFNSLPVNEQASTKLLKVARLLEQNPSVPDSVIDLIYDAENAKSSIDFVTEEIILSPERFKVPTIVVGEGNFIPASKNVDSTRLSTERERERLIREQKFKSPGSDCFRRRKETV